MLNAMARTYVIGHVNPDTDSIAAAVGYAWLLREKDGADVVAARAGALNPQTSWVLKRLGMDPPVLMSDASPRFEAVTRRLDTTHPDRPLREAWAIASRTWGVAPVVNETGTPYGLVNGSSLFFLMSEMVGPRQQRQEMKMAELMELPCHEAAITNVPKFPANGRIRDSLNRILREESDDFWVVDENGLYIGICRQREILNPPRIRVILVDHNEPRQALGSLDEAELLEILDHHRLGNPSTHTPIRFSVDVVGSTSTLVSERIEDKGLSAPPTVAGLLLAGLLSDTLILNSPTTTPRDHRAADRLARWAFVRNGPLPNETIQSYGEQVLRAGAELSTRHPDEIVSTDFKVYEAGGFRFGIAQVEVTDLVQIEDRKSELRDALELLREKKGLDFGMLMVTDVVRGTSRMLLANAPPVLLDLPFTCQPDDSFLAEGIVSRKKQLLPIVLGLLEK
jgi:manganese-dependent inorganic pyrophosphatase